MLDAMGSALDVNALLKGLQRTAEIEEYLTKYFERNTRDVVSC